MFPLQRWLVLSHLAVLLLPLLTLVGTGALAQDLEQQTQDDLDHQASLLALHVSAELRHASTGQKPATIADISDATTRLLVDAKQSTLAGFRVVDDRGVVVASSGDGVGDDIADDAEVRAALAGAPGLALRPRPTDGSRQQSFSSASRRSNVRVFVAHPVRLGDTVVGAVVLSRTPREEWQTLWQMAPQLWLGGLFAVAVTTGLSVVAGHYLSRSMARLSTVAGRIAGGEMGVDEALRAPEGSHVREVAELAASLRTMSLRLRERLAYISDFAANVSHEFKTPVASLLGTIEILRDDAEEGADSQLTAVQKARFLEHATQDLERLSRLVGGLLRLARAEEGLDREAVDVHALVREVGERLGVRIESEASNVETLANAAELRSVVTNLVENARTHAGPGACVRIDLVGDTDFDVVDDGVGVSPANLPRMFERFFTTARETGGTGLGLAYVRAVVTAHGGRVTVETRPTFAGTRFSVRLPERTPVRR